MDKTIKYKQMPIEIKEQSDGIITFIASTDSPDRMGDVIEQDGWDLTNFKNNPVIPWGHDYSQPPIGRAINAYVANNKLYVDVDFASKVYPYADLIEKMIRAGYIKSVSVGFRPIEGEPLEASSYGFRYTKCELLEVSVVTVPANAQALVQMQAKGINTKLALEKNLIEVVENKNDENIKEIKPEVTGKIDDSQIVSEKEKEITPMKQINKVKKSTLGREFEVGDTVSFELGGDLKVGEIEEIIDADEDDTTVTEEDPLYVVNELILNDDDEYIETDNFYELRNADLKKIRVDFDDDDDDDDDDDQDEKEDSEDDDDKNDDDKEKSLDTIETKVEFIEIEKNNTKESTIVKINEERKQKLQLYRKWFVYFREKMQLPKLEDEEKSVKQVFELLETLIENSKKSEVNLQNGENLIEFED